METETAKAIYTVLWGLAFWSPFVVAVSGHWRRLAATLKHTKANNALAWLIALPTGMAFSMVASVGVAFAFMSVAYDVTLWTAAMVCALLQPLALLAWAVATRPDTDVGGVELVGLVASLTLAVTTNVFLWILGHDGTLANYVPAGLHLLLPVFLLLATGMRIAELGGCLPTYYRPQ